MIDVKEIKNVNPDILVAKVIIGDTVFFMITVYVSTNDDMRNINIYNQLTKLLDTYQNEKLLIQGDFNGHTGIIGKQKLNKNGKKVLNLLEMFNLSMLNLDDRCVGEITWEQGNNNSVIDFVLVNEILYRLPIYLYR